MFSDLRFGRRALGVVLPLVMIGSAASAAARNVTDEVGRWVGFAHQHGQFVAGAHVVLDLTASATAGRLEGTISGLPAVQNSLRVLGSVTGGGIMRLTLSGDGITGFCDGSVNILRNYSKAGDPDVIGDFEYSVTFATSAAPVRGHVNLLHLYGGINWGDMQVMNLLGSSHGAFMTPRANEADGSVMKIDEQRGSLISGLIGLLNQPFDMVGTVNSHGSTIMMCDGSVRAGDTVGLIGLLFSGGATAPASGGPADLVGHYGSAAFGLLLPAVQRGRGGVMSFEYGG